MDMGFRRKPTAVVFVGGRNCPSFRSIYVHPRFRYSVLFVFRFLLFFVRFLVFHTLCFSLFVVLFLCLWLKTHISYTRNSQNTDSFFCSWRRSEILFLVLFLLLFTVHLALKGTCYQDRLLSSPWPPVP